MTRRIIRTFDRYYHQPVPGHWVLFPALNPHRLPNKLFVLLGVMARTLQQAKPNVGQPTEAGDQE